ncbi:MAG: hypothetical protein EBX40_05625, partial [Gammaproteobacteria bacterium]|nr:hypothetical protein [Gammaproteobacteria bacterium]
SVDIHGKTYSAVECTEIFDKWRHSEDYELLTEVEVKVAEYLEKLRYPALCVLPILEFIFANNEHKKLLKMYKNYDRVLMLLNPDFRGASHMEDDIKKALYAVELFVFPERFEKVEKHFTTYANISVPKHLLLDTDEILNVRTKKNDPSITIYDIRRVTNRTAITYLKK